MSHSFNAYLIDNDCVPGIILDIWYLYCKQSRPIPCANGAYILEVETINAKKKINKLLCDIMPGTICVVESKARQRCREKMEVSTLS